MTTVIIVVVIALFSAIVYALHHGYGVSTAMQVIGLRLTFEARKPERDSPRRKSG